MRIRYIAILLIIGWQQAAAQAPVAAFTGNPLRGCAPLVVSFTDQSSGNPTNWNWDFGNSQISTNKNNTITYTQPGTYTVTLVARNASGIDAITKTAYIVVNEAPVVNFSINRASGCANAVFTFTDQSTSSASTITGWQWDFGDNTTGSGNTSTHTYASPGVYNVKLTVTDANGCQSALTKYSFVQVVKNVSADFSYSPASCSAPFSVNFKSLSIGSGTLSYVWVFHNGISTANAPTWSYGVAGDYQVKMIANSSFGCSDSITKTITINGPNTDFTVSNTCFNSTTSFQNTGSTPVSSTWRFGNGAQSTRINTTYKYPAPGTYQVTLVNVYAGCTDSVRKSVTIGSLPVDFTAPNTVSCQTPFNVNFQNTTPGAASALWNFGDGTPSSTDINPAHTYTASGQYTVKLTVTDNTGCTDSITKTNFVNATGPAVTVSNNRTGGCVPHTYSPVAVVTGSDPVTGYSWDFGEGAPPQTGTAPTYIYNNPGTFDLVVTATTAGGCTSSFTRQIRVGVPAAALDFTADATVACARVPVIFHGVSSTPGVTWQWSFGDGGAARIQDPSYIYTDTGFYNIRLTATNNGCSRSVTKNRYIQVVPPIARFSTQVDCVTGKTVRFTNETITTPAVEPLTYSWDFGDPAIPASSAPNPTASYTDTGTYRVTLTVSSPNGCTNSFSKDVFILTEPANFTVNKAEVCTNESFNLAAAPYDPGHIIRYYWTIGTNPEIAGTIVQPYSLNAYGQYDVTLRLIDTNGCEHTQTKNNFITVSGPLADFTTPAVTCGAEAAIFTDLTTSPKPVSSWKWDFGDGQTQTFSSGPFTHTYADEGVYEVELTVTDNAGCANTITIPDIVKVRKPVAFFRKDTTVWCPSAPVSFTDSSSGTGLRYEWAFGDGSTSTAQNPSNSYSIPERDYNVSLKVTDDLGCADSISRLNYIQVRIPKPGFTLADSLTLCQPFIAAFTLTGTDYQTASWNFDDGSPASPEISPQHAYQSYGTFTPVLTLTGNGGCTADTSRNIVIVDPATIPFNYVAPETCNSLTVDFSITPPSWTSFALWFGDGQADSSQATQVSHTYGPAFYRPSIVLKEQSGCQVTVNGQTEIRVLGAEPLFGVNSKEFCDTADVNFNSLTLGNDPITSYNWDFGDGNFSSAINPSNRYIAPGTYRVTFSVTTQGNCSSSFSDTIKVYTSPIATISSKDTVCLKESVLFTSTVPPDTSGILYNWSFGDGTASTADDPIKQFNSTGSFSTVLVTSIPAGCTSTTSRPINVVPLPVVDPIPDQNIIVGQGVTIPATYSPGIIQYAWTPVSGLDCSDCPTPFAEPKKTIKYTVTVTDHFGCAVSGDVTITVTCNNNNFFVPNTFSPNNDGVNDRFYPRGTGLVRVQSMTIYNRWGEVMFDKRDFLANSASAGWDGTYKGKPAVSDVYIYSLEVICENSQVIPVKGNIMLLR